MTIIFRRKGGASPSVGGGGGPALIFASSWNSGTGQGATALEDGGLWTDSNTGHVLGGVGQLTVVSASGVGLPAGISNFLEVLYDGENSADVRISGLGIPPNGGSRYWRAYLRFRIPTGDQGGFSGAGAHHPIEPEPGLCPFNFELKYGFNTAGSGMIVQYIRDYTDTNPALDHASYEISGPGLVSRNTWYRQEWAFKNRDSATDFYKCGFRMYNMSNVLVVDEDDMLQAAGANPPMSTVNPDVEMETNCIDRMLFGTNGPTSWPFVRNAQFDVAAVACSDVDWCGPFVPGEHA